MFAMYVNDVLFYPELATEYGERNGQIDLK